MRREGQRRLPSELSLMEKYGVSRQTVRRALSLLAAQGLIESRQGSGTYLHEQSADALMNIALITTYSDDYIFPSLLEELRAGFAEYGYTPVIYTTDNSVKEERRILLSLLDNPCAGILAQGCCTAIPSPNTDLYDRLRARGVPIVFLHGAHDSIQSAVCVADDNYAGGYTLGKYLVDKGHRRIAGIFKSDDAQGPQRYHGCVSALRDAGTLPSDENILWYSTLDRPSLLSGRSPELMRRFVERYLGSCTAVVCYNDEVAYSLIKALLSRGRRIPQEVAVVSFDNSYFSELGAVGITSLGHEPLAVSRAAVESMIKMIRSQHCESVEIPWRLYERKSSL